MNFKMSENTHNIMKYGMFCAVVVNDVEMLKQYLPRSVEHGFNIGIFRIEYKTLQELDSSMLRPVLSDDRHHTVEGMDVKLFYLVEAEMYPVLYLCCLNNSATMLRTILAVVVMDKTKEACTLLHNLLQLNCTLGNVECVSVLLEAGISPDEESLLAALGSYDPDSQVKDPKSYLNIAEMIVVNWSSKDENLWSTLKSNPLCTSCAKSDAKLTELLVSHGADINAISAVDNYKTPLIIAIENSSVANLEVLLSAGVDVNLCSTLGSPLGTAIQAGNLSIFMSLLEAGAKPNLVSALEDPAQLLTEPMTSATSKQYLVFLWLLLCHHGNVDTVNHFDEGSLLLTMTRYQNLAGAKLLLQYNADINLENKLGTTPLWAAVMQNNKSLVELFIYANADLDVPSLEYNIYCPYVAATLALQRGFWDVLYLLLEAGGEIRPHKIHSPDRAVAALFRNQPDIQFKLQDWLESVKHLKFLCRCVIRKCFKSRIDKKINELPNFPLMLKHYILLEDECRLFHT